MKQINEDELMNVTGGAVFTYGKATLSCQKQCQQANPNNEVGANDCMSQCQPGKMQKTATKTVAY